MTDRPQTPWEQAANDIAARFEHGHDELTEGCALCIAEWRAVMDLTYTTHMEEE